MSSFFAGVSGALFAMFATTVQAKVFTSAMTYEILLIVVIGGIGSVSGSCIASLPVHRVLRVVAALPRQRGVHRLVQGAAAAQRFPYGRVLDHHHDRRALLPQGHHGRARAAGSVP
ncbi:MAG: ABC transporter permease subunit [Oscillospiraceae bacterium]